MPKSSKMRDKQGKPYRIELSQPKSIAKEFFLKEYDRVSTEIREINKNTVEYIKLFIAFATSIFIYSFGGFFYYKTLKESGKFFFAYSLFGALLTFTVILVTAFVFSQLANSKKIKTRYWRSLDIMREYIKKSFPDYLSAIPFPPENSVKHYHIPPKQRPNVTTAEMYSYIALGFLAELIWLVVFVYFITNILESWGSIDRGRLIKAIFVANLLLITMILFMPSQVLKIRKMFKETEMIDKNNFYPECTYGVHSRRIHFIFIIIGVILYVILGIKIFLLPEITFSNWYFFFYSIVLLVFSNAYNVLVSLFYFLQKKRSSDAIEQFRKENERDPLALWKHFTKLELQ